MHWIINSGLRREVGYEAMIARLEARGTPHTLVRKPPLVGHLVADEPDEAGGLRPIMLDPIEGPVFVIGTTSMKTVSEAHGWSPGFIDAPTTRECHEAWGPHMLNDGAVFGTLGDVSPPDGRFFIRPDRAGKSFSGTVLDAATFEDWRRDLVGDAQRPGATADTEVMVAPIRTIWSEYRCILVDGRYATGSRYKTGTTWAQSPDVGSRIVRFAEERGTEWRPRRAMCIDVADTPEGLKVIEANAVSSAGFYSNDMARFVDAIEEAGPW